MKQFLSVLLIVSFFFLSGCISSPVYHADWPYYHTVDELIEAADEIFTGKILDIHFEVIDALSGKVVRAPSNEGRLLLHTVYEIEVHEILKGTQGKVKYVCILGGIQGYGEKEQLSKLRACGIGGNVVPILESGKKLEIGETYLFSVAEAGGGDYLNVINLDQFAFPENTERDEGDASTPNYNNIISAFK